MGYNHSTEALIIVSQSVFFIVMFLMIKSYLLDNSGFMSSAEKLKDKAMQVAAIYFAIIVFIGGIMYPLYHYDYALPVLIVVIVGISFVIYRDVTSTLSGGKPGVGGTATKKNDNKFVPPTTGAPRNKSVVVHVKNDKNADDNVTRSNPAVNLQF